MAYSRGLLPVSLGPLLRPPLVPTPQNIIIPLGPPLVPNPPTSSSRARHYRSHSRSDSVHHFRSPSPSDTVRHCRSSGNQIQLNFSLPLELRIRILAVEAAVWRRLRDADVADGLIGFPDRLIKFSDRFTNRLPHGPAVR